MPSYSSSQFFQDWRYAIEKDFVRADGSPYPYAEGGKQEWGDEARKISFDGKPINACVSGDGKHLAVALKKPNDIHIIDTASFATVVVLKGHVSRVDGMAFKPHDSNILVSSEQNDYAGSAPTEPTIIIWDIKEYSMNQHVEDSLLSDISKVVARHATELLARSQLMLSETEQHGLAALFEPSLAKVVRKHDVAKNVRLRGRLQISFQSNIFSPSGKWMAYLPVSRQSSNSLAARAIVICSTDDLQEHVVLTGHTDAVRWTGWSRDERLIGTVAWDETIRIWDNATGTQIHEFKTDGQNWTGAFSPDSKYFAATCGRGTVHVYSLIDGTTYWVYELGRRSGWCRAIEWHPDGNLIAVGAENGGQVLLLDVTKKGVLQDRWLSSAASQPDDKEILLSISSWVEVYEVRFVDDGTKLVAWATGDGSVEVFDLAQQVKWRFARGGTDTGPRSGEWKDENGKVTSKCGHGMVVWEDQSKGDVFLAGIDHDAVRIWTVGLSKAG